MTLCLYECLRAVGLQHHYARFTSVGVCRTAHISVLTMEDYPLLGIHTMEDRTRLFQLVQFVKTLDLEGLGYDDDDDYHYSYGGRVEGSTIVDSSFCHDSDSIFDDEDGNGAAVNNIIASTFARPSHVRRRLDFSNETSDHHQRLSHPVVHVNMSYARYEESIRKKGSATSVQHQYRPKSKPANVTSNTFNHKPLGHKDRKRTTRKKTLYTEMDTDGCMCKPTPVYEAKRTAGYNYGLPMCTPPAQCKQARQAEEQRIKVCVRKRPLTCTESRQREADVVTTPGGECVIVHEVKEAVDLSQYILQHKFYFDQVFGEKSSNEEVYHQTAYPLVQHMLKGGKVTCFAYGQTGAGKTHTMLGSPAIPGVYALAVQDIFAHLSATHSNQLVFVSFFEIYCGQLYDLLDHRKRLFAREDGQKVVHISGLRDVRVDSVSSLLEVISQGTAERTQGMSGVNPLSSRSHALLQIQLRDSNQQIAGRMWFVDLAGSERASDAKEPDRQSRMEGAEINQSLLALKECIRSLDQEQSHTPFRQSKLTQVLKDSFVGDSMTCMIANISPGHTATEHTLNTLRYADRVKELKRQGGLRGRRRNRGIPEDILGSSQDQDSNQKQTPPATFNKPPTSPLKKSTCTSVQGLRSLQDLMTNDAQVPPEYAHDNHEKLPLASILTPQLESVSGYTPASQCHTVYSKHSSNSTTSLQPNNLGEFNDEESTTNHHVRPTIQLFNLDDLDHAKWCIFKAHWEQLKEMEALCRKEGKLLCQQPDMAFGEYVEQLEEIMEKKARCVHSMRAQLQPYLKPITSIHPQGADDHRSTS